MIADDQREDAIVQRRTSARLLGIVGCVFATWGVVVGILSAADVLGAHPGGVAVSIFVSWGLAVAAFVIAYRRSPTFAAMVLSIDLRLVVSFQLARFAGVAFFAEYNNHRLPAASALLPGVLDLFICYSALMFAFYLLDRRPFPRRIFLAWNVIGIGDFVATALIFYLIVWNVLYPAQPDWAGYLVVTRFPFSLISCFMVPLAIVMHVIAMLQTRHERWRSMTPIFTEAPPLERSMSVAGK